MSFRCTMVACALVVSALSVSRAASAQQPNASLAPREGTVRLSLDEALRLAEPASENVGIARVGLERASGEARQAKSGFFPQLAGSASYTRTIETQFSGLAADSAVPGPLGPCNGYRPDPNLPIDERVTELERAVDCTVNGNPFGGADLPFGQPNTWNFGLSASQTIFDQRLIGRTQAANAARRSAAFGVGLQQAQNLLDVASAYYDALLAERLLIIADSTLAQAERTLRDVQLAKEAGTRPEFDLLRAQVSRDNVRPTVIARRTDRDLAFVRLRQLLDLPAGVPLELTTTIAEADVTTMPFPTPVEALRAASDTLEGVRALVRATEEDVDSRKGLLKAAKGEQLPVLSASSDYARIGFGSEFFPSWNDFVDDWSVSVRMSLPLFTGGRIAGAKQAARANLEEAQLRLKQTRELSERDSITIVATRESAEATWAASSGTVQQAERAYQIAELRFREGVSTQTELSDARLSLLQASATRVQAARDLLVARLREVLLPYLPLGTANAAATISTTTAALTGVSR